MEVVSSKANKGELEIAKPLSKSGYGEYLKEPVRENG